jgi:hypothetical protein
MKHLIAGLFLALALGGCSESPMDSTGLPAGVVVDGIDNVELAKRYPVIVAGDAPHPLLSLTHNQWDDACIARPPQPDWDSVVVKGLQSGFARDTAFLISGWTSAPVRGYVFRDGGRDCAELVSWAKATLPGGNSGHTWAISVTGAQTANVLNGNGIDALLIGQAFHPSQGKGMDTIYVAD